VVNLILNVLILRSLGRAERRHEDEFRQRVQTIVERLN